MPRASRRKHGPNHDNQNGNPGNIEDVFDNNGKLDWSVLEKKTNEEVDKARRQEIGKIAMIATNSTAAVTEDFLNERRKLARLGVHLERIRKEENGQKRVAYRILTEKYGNALDKQRIYNEKLNLLQGTANKPQWVPGDSMTTIANCIPKIEGQTGQEYAEYITKIHNQIPKEKNEDDAIYRQRILNAYNNGDLQFFAAHALIDPWSEADIAIERCLSRITELQKRLRETPNISQEQQDYIRSQLKKAKLGLYKIAIDAEREDLALKNQKSKARKKSFLAKITSPIFGKNERRNRNELRLSKKEGMSIISELIPRIEGQTAKDYRDLIAEIYSRRPKVIGETSTEYERQIDGTDLYTLAARILINKQLGEDDSSSSADSVENEIRVKFNQIEDALRKLDSRKATELAAQIRQTKINTFKKLVEARINTLANR